LATFWQLFDNFLTTFEKKNPFLIFCTNSTTFLKKCYFSWHFIFLYL
jgi:hypothetical protein